MSWSISTMVTEPCSARMSAATRTRSGAESPASGSSSSSSLGRVASAMAISSSRWSPCDRFAASVPACSARPTARSRRAASAAASVRRVLSASIAKRRGCLACTASRTFSNTLSDWKTLMIWNERDTPRATTRCGGSPVMTAPSKRASPPSGASSPVTTLKSVVLPAPLGPITERSSPRLTPNEAPSTAASPPKYFVTPSTSSSGRPSSRVTGAGAAGAGVAARASAGAGEAGALLVLANALQHAAEGRVHDAPQHPDGGRRHHGRRVVVDALVAEVHAQDPGPERKALDAAQAVLAARHPRGAIDDVEEHLREGQREQRAVHAALAHQQEADDGAGQRGHGHAGQQRHHHALHEVDLHEPGRVAAEAEERAVAEGDEPGVAHQEVVGDGEQREDDDLRAERHRGLHRRHHERDDEEPGVEPHQRMAGRARDQSNFSQRSPMRPRGRSRRITAISTYIEASAARGWK